MFYIILREFKSHFKKLTGTEEYEDMESNALTAYDATAGTDATAATTEGPQDQETARKLQMSCLPELQIRTKLGNPGVLKATSGNAAKRKGKTDKDASWRKR